MKLLHMPYLMKSTILTIVMLIVLGIGAYIAYTSALTPEPSADPLAGFSYEIVTTPEAQERGLGGRADIPHRYGMLFVFPNAERYGFWMKGMLVPIDIIWLADDGTVLGIEHEVSPDTYPTAFYAPSPVRYVLETRAGEARATGLANGSRIALPVPE